MLSDVQVHLIIEIKTFIIIVFLNFTGPAATDIAWVGAGSADAFLHGGIHCWDMVAGALIIEEAGGCVLNSDGSDFDFMGRQIIAASSKELALEIVSKIKIYQIDREFVDVCPM